MAIVQRIREVYEQSAPAAASETTDYALVGLQAVIDLDEDSRRLHVAELRFADYAGLEAEYTGDTGTTVINAAVDTYLGALGASADEDLPSSYASWVTHTAAWTP